MNLVIRKTYDNGAGLSRTMEFVHEDVFKARAEVRTAAERQVVCLIDIDDYIQICVVPLGGEVEIYAIDSQLFCLLKEPLLAVGIVPPIGVSNIPAK